MQEMSKTEMNKIAYVLAVIAGKMAGALPRQVLAEAEAYAKEKGPEPGVVREPVTRFKPPTVDEVRDYCRTRNNSVDARAFCNYYGARGWKLGSTEMKDWKAAVRTWEQRDGYNPEGNDEGRLAGLQ